MVVLGIDIGGAQIRAGMVDESGAILASRTIPTPTDLDSFLPVAARRHSLAARSDCRPGRRGYRLQGHYQPRQHADRNRSPERCIFSKGCASPIWSACRSTCPYSPITRRASRSRARWSGAPRSGLQNVVMLTLGTGVGGAVMAGGHLLRGHTGVAGHLGHITVEPDGAVCSCGNRGCLETVFSARAIEGEAWSAVHRGCASSLTRLFREQPQLATCRTVFQAASEGDDLARSIVGTAIHKLAAAIAGLLHVFDPEIVIVGGQVADAGADLLTPLREEVWARSRGLVGRDVPIVEQQVADKSGIVGAAGLVMAPRD